MYIPDDGIRLNLKLDRPEGQAKCPLVIVIHGFTGHMEERHIVAVAETMNGQKALAVSPTLSVRYNQAQIAMRDNARQNGLSNLFGRYAMVQYASSAADPVVALPTFQTIEFQPNRPISTFSLREESKETGRGLLNWLPFGTPQISLHKKPALPVLPLGETIQVWYAFLEGQGPDRTWYLIGMGDGTRWALLPLERFAGAPLDGVWVSKTERWEFSGTTVTLTRDGHTGSGTFRLAGHILEATGMPRKTYAVALDTSRTHLTLMSREGEASILTRKVPAPASSQKSEKDAVAQLLGAWISGPETGYASLTIRPVPSTPYCILRLVSKGQGETVCTVAVQGDRLLATFRDNTHAVIPYTFLQGRLTLFFPRMPEISFTRK